MKWQLIEILQMEERELQSLCSIKRYSELIETIRSQTLDNIFNGKKSGGSGVTVKRIVSFLDQLSMQSIKTEIVQAITDYF